VRTVALGAVAVEPGAHVAAAIASLGASRGADSVMEFVGLRPKLDISGDSSLDYGA
jgi:hypothetical protein